MSYDAKCYELSRAFLADEPKSDTEVNRIKLAIRIQYVIEETLEELCHHAHTCQQCEKLLNEDCDCGRPDVNVWCSSNCRAAFDL